MFPVTDLPALSKGKGNKIISIPAAEAAEGKDTLAWLLLLPPGSVVTLHVGKRKLTLREEDLQNSEPNVVVAVRCYLAGYNGLIGWKWMRRHGQRPGLRMTASLLRINRLIFLPADSAN